MTASPSPLSSLWDRLLGRRRPAVAAVVGSGFVATEAAAHQPALEMGAGSGLTAAADARLSADLTLHPGSEGVVVIAWKNRNVGFAPAEEARSLLAQLTAAGENALAASGEVFRHAGSWRVWVGPLPRPHDADVPPDTLPPKPPTIAGVPTQRP